MPPHTRYEGSWGRNNGIEARQEDTSHFCRILNIASLWDESSWLDMVAKEIKRWDLSLFRGSLPHYGLAYLFQGCPEANEGCEAHVFDVLWRQQKPRTIGRVLRVRELQQEDPLDAHLTPGPVIRPAGSIIVHFRRSAHLLTEGFINFRQIDRSQQ